MHIWKLDFLCETLLETSHLAIESQADCELLEKKVADNTSETYTSADVAVEKSIHSRFSSRAEALGSRAPILVGEESITDFASTKALGDALQDSCIIVDPIDGTQNYINRLPNWCISIGRTENNEFVDGCIALPDLGRCYLSYEGSTYYSASHCLLSKVKSLVPSPFSYRPIRSEQHLLYSAAFQLPNNKNKVHIDRSSVYSIANVISGSYFAYIGKAKIWDFAACIGIFRNMGMPVYYFDKKQMQVHILPWRITDEYWIDYTYARYPIIFAGSYEHAKQAVGL